METSTLVLLLGLLWRCCLSYRYFYETSNLTWEEAQQNCRRFYTDLATFDDMKDIESLQRTPGMEPWHWIGLRDDPQTWKSMTNASTSWRWSSTGKTVPNGFSNWEPEKPTNTGETCALIDSAGKWHDEDCEIDRVSICFDDSAGVISYVYNSALLTWSEAQAYCRQHHVDLAIIESAQANIAVTQAIPTKYWTWIGLFRIPYSWSDQSTGTFRNWKPLQPDNLNGNDHCAFETELHEWDDAPCDLKLPSICYKPDWETKKTTLRQTMRSSIDLRDPAILQQIQQQLVELLSKTRSDVALQLKVERLDLDKRDKCSQPPCPP